MFIINPDIENYIKDLSRKIKIEDEEIISQLERYADETDFPIINREVGLLIHLITKLKKPKLVVELGSGFGYSAYWFAKAMEDGKVVLIDYQEKNIEKAKELFEKTNLTDKAVFEVGDAVEIAKKYQNIDILFLDLEKSRYLEAIKQLENNLNQNALIIADNTLWYGNVVNPQDNKSKIMAQFNEYMFENYLSILIPIRDGVLIAYKD